MAQGTRQRRDTWSGTLGLVAALALLAWHVAHSNFLIDDAFISFRYAANWAAGEGLAFNPGEPPVEGYSNFLWVALLSVAARASIPLELASRVLSIGAAAATLLLLHRSLAARGFARHAVALGPLVLAAFPPFATWTTGGLETALFALLFFVALDALLPRPGTSPRSQRVPLLISAALLPLVRTDGFAFALALALAVLLTGSADARKRLAPFLAAALVSFLAYLAWRRMHYGTWVANTVRVKADPSVALLLRGLRTSASYLCVFGSPLLVLAALLPGRPGPAPVHARRSFVTTAALAFGAFLAYNTLVGGDWMPMFRMLAPASPLLAVAVAGLVDRMQPPGGWACGAVAIAVGLLPSFDRSVAPLALREALDFRGFQTGYQSERARWRRGVDNLATFSTIGRGLAQVAPPGASITAGAIGAIGYYSGLHVLDRNGLVEPSVAALPADPRGKSAGHDKRVARAYFLDRRPTYFEAKLVDRNVAGPDAPAFAQTARWIAGVFQEPGERELVEHCLPEAHPLAPGEGIPAGHTLVVLRATDDRERARAFWRSLGL